MNRTFVTVAAVSFAAGWGWAYVVWRAVDRCLDWWLNRDERKARIWREREERRG